MYELQERIHQMIISDVVCNPNEIKGLWKKLSDYHDLFYCIHYWEYVE